MNIIGPDYLVFGVDDLRGSIEYLTAFGLKPVDVNDKGGLFEALDGTGIIVRHKSDPTLPPPLLTSNMLRQQIYGVQSAADLDAIAAELSGDHRVTRLSDGSIETKDDQGFELKFQLTIRRELRMPAEKINALGAPAQRKPNEMASGGDAGSAAVAEPRCSLRARRRNRRNFYSSRLGFVITDVLKGAGPFLRPKANDDHHTLFFIRTPEYMKGCEHLAFHMGGPTELMVAGTRFVKKGYQSFWGPGRHKFGSNWF